LCKVISIDGKFFPHLKLALRLKYLTFEQHIGAQQGNFSKTPIDKYTLLASADHNSSNHAQLLFLLCGEKNSPSENDLSMIRQKTHQYCFSLHENFYVKKRSGSAARMTYCRCNVIS